MKRLGFIAGIVLPLAVLIFANLGDSAQVNNMAACALMMSVFWISEAIPLAATSLLPLFLFPILGIASSKATASQYMNSTVFLLIGGFMIALAMQRWNLHRRIALNVLALFGGHPLRLVCGFMIATAGLSMWISNTATTLMMLPIALAIISRYEGFLTVAQAHRFSLGLLLAIAYSASIGGMMTLVGTAPNLVFSRFYQIVSGETIGFAQWMMIAIPVGVCLLFVVVLMIGFCFFRNLPESTELKRVVLEEKKGLGKISNAEKVVLVVFFTTALLWITRKSIQMGELTISGWSDYLTFGKMIDDGSVAIAMAIALFFVPVNDENNNRTRVLNQDVFSELPWPIVLLFGGGFALAFGFSESGLSAYIANQFQAFKSLSLPWVIVGVSGIMNLLTELTSNTATTQLVMPILLSTAKAFELNPVWLMLPATLSASCAFMFPVATPPNAIIFGSGRIKVYEMVRVGVALNIFAVLVVSGISYYFIPYVLE